MKHRATRQLAQPPLRRQDLRGGLVAYSCLTITSKLYCESQPLPSRSPAMP
ncbi:MAG: hypothetical protein OXG04_29950 [Acidobacteria bacterium]|nr:hypothetical protein [Acidobacteriota bacterium]